jgi:hypothetical protein
MSCRLRATAGCAIVPNIVRRISPLLASMFAALLAASALAQNVQPSLADAARKSKSQPKPAAKPKVWTDDDIASVKSPETPAKEGNVKPEESHALKMLCGIQQMETRCGSTLHRTCGLEELQQGVRLENTTMAFAPGWGPRDDAHYSYSIAFRKDEYLRERYEISAVPRAGKLRTFVQSDKGEVRAQGGASGQDLPGAVSCSEVVR